MADDIKTKQQAIALIKKMREDYGFRYFRKAPPAVAKREVDLINKFHLSSKDISS